MAVGTQDQQSGLTGLLTIGLLLYAVVGLVVAAWNLDAGQMFGLSHFLGFVRDIASWPLTLL